MSFILSALKKVENKRNLGSVPELSSIQIQSFENLENRRHRLVTTLSIVGIVSVALFAAFWFYKPLMEQSIAEQKTQSVVITTPVIDGVITQPIQPTQTPTPQTTIIQAPVSQTPQTNIVPTNTVPPNTASPNAILPNTAPPNVVLPNTAPYVTHNNPTPNYYPQQPQTFNNNVAVPQSPTYTPPVSPNLYQNPAGMPKWEPLPVGIVNYEDLPNRLRERIPNIQLSAHIHSDLRPQARKVIINGVALREGQRLSDDLSVHQINSDGVVMDYQGTLFLLSKANIFN